LDLLILLRQLVLWILEDLLVQYSQLDLLHQLHQLHQLGRSDQRRPPEYHRFQQALEDLGQ
jgi:hypothetical protein